MRPDVNGLLPVFVVDEYDGYTVKRVQDCTRAELDAWVEANAASLREHDPADLVFVNHVLLGGPVGATSGMRYVVKAHGSELEYSMRGNDELARWGSEALAGAAATIVGSEHIREVVADVCGTIRPRPYDPSRSGRRAVAAAATYAGARVARGGGETGSAESGERERAPPRRGQRRPARGVPRGRALDRRVLRKVDPQQRRAGAARRTARARRARGHRRLRRLPRRARGAGGGSRRALHGAAGAPPSRAPARARGRAVRCRRSSRRRSAWSPRSRRPRVAPRW